MPPPIALDVAVALFDAVILYVLSSNTVILLLPLILLLAMPPTAPALLNAIKDATGVRLYMLPATPSRVLAALRVKAVGMEGGS